MKRTHQQIIDSIKNQLEGAFGDDYLDEDIIVKMFPYDNPRNVFEAVAEYSKEKKARKAKA